LIKVFLTIRNDYTENLISDNRIPFQLFKCCQQQENISVSGFCLGQTHGSASQHQSSNPGTRLPVAQKHAVFIQVAQKHAVFIQTVRH